MNENQNNMAESEDIPNYEELTDDDKAVLETFIDIITALDKI